MCEGLRSQLWENVQLSFNLDSSLSMSPHNLVMIGKKNVMHAYYQQAPGYESRDSSLSKNPERETENGLPTQETIAVDESVGDNRENDVKLSKNHRSPPMTSGNIAHPAAVRAAIAEV